MRIDRRELSPERRSQLGSDIARSAFAKGVTGRVCGGACTLICPHCGSTACQCRCAPDCPDAPRALSADPDRYPIEPRIVPLVFALKRSGMFFPCWSCEGHLRPDGSLWKLPSVWFYCDSAVHVRLLSAGLEAMAQAGSLSAVWHVVVTHSDPDNPETTFSLEPAESLEQTLELSSLQRDVAAIAGAFHDLVTDQARKLQRDAGRVLAGDR